MYQLYRFIFSFNFASFEDPDIPAAEWIVEWKEVWSKFPVCNWATEKGPILVVAKMHLAQFLASLPTKTVENKLVDITIKQGTHKPTTTTRNDKIGG